MRPPQPSTVIDVVLDERLEHGSTPELRLGAQMTTVRVGWLGGHFHQLRMERPLIARRGDALALSTADGAVVEGTVLDPHAARHGPKNDALVRLTRLQRGTEGATEPPPLDADALALERRYLVADIRPPADAELSEVERAALFALREAGRVVLVAPGTHMHVDAGSGSAG